MDDFDHGSFQPIHNPYIVGNPIKDRKMFFGREDDFAYIQKKVSGGEKGGLLILCGSRRSGKTSILFQVQDGRLGSEFFPVLIDMQAMAVENDLDFLIKLGQGIVDAIGDSGLSLEKDFLGQPEGGSFSKFEKFIVKVNETLAGKKLILLFDEYEIFESHIEKNLISTGVINLLANWIDYKEGAFIVFTGSDRLDERTADFWSGLLPKALYRGISFLSTGDTFRLIHDPVKDSVRYEEGVAEEIYKLTAGQPFYTQVYCQALVDHLNEYQEYDVRMEDLRTATDEIIENPLPQMIFSWNSLSPLEKIALSVIGEINRKEVKPVSAKDIIEFTDGEKIGYKIDPAKLNEVLEKLFHHDLLNKESSGDAYTFKMGLWSRWVGRMHTIWQVIDDLAGAEEEDIEGLEKVRPARVRSVILVAAGVVALVVVSALIYQIMRGDGTALQTVQADSTLVTIRTDPPGAWVFLNDRRIDRSPITNAPAVAGQTLVRIELDGYKAFADTFDLRKDEPLDTSFALVEQTGHIEVTSSPSGADILLDGERTGLRTPATLEGIPVREFHRVGLRLAAHTAHEWPTVQIQEDTTITLQHAFSKLRCQVTFESAPAGAEIVVDGAVEGTTPSVVFLGYGEHELVLRRSGYEPIEKTIALASRSRTIQETLTKLPQGTLVLKIMPYADIYINGELESRQDDRHEISLDPGRYEIELRNPHFDNITMSVDIVSNETTERTIDMKRGRESQ